MKTQKIIGTPLEVSRLGYGCAKLGGSSRVGGPVSEQDRKTAIRAVRTALDEGIRGTCQGDDVELTREEWYLLFQAGRGSTSA